MARRTLSRSLPRFLAAPLLALAFASSCTSVAVPPEGATPAARPATEPRLTPVDAGWVESTLASLSLEAQVGQLVFPWISGAYWADDDPEFEEALGWVENDEIGGVVISIGTPLAYAAKLNALQARARVPLLVTSDFENGGPGMRIAHLYALPTLLSAGGGTSFPPTMAFGAVGDEGLVERFARATAREARAVGVHVVFAPVLDVNSNPENPIINTRAFGEDPADVARMGRAFLRGARAGGALATAKHFPGHGDTRVDSHLTLPEVSADRARLEAVEFVPFRAAIEEGVDGIMTAHVSMPGVLGPNAPPATLSPVFMTDILRRDMGFGGIVYTDALRMGAITEAYGAGEAAVLAFEAGADVILIPADVPEAIRSLVDAVESGRISRERLAASVRRVLGEKSRVELHRRRDVPMEAVSATVGSGAHRALADSVSERAMTLVRDRDGLLPPDPARLARVVSVTWAAPTDLVAGREFDAVLGALIPGAVRSVRVGPDTPAATFDALLGEVAGADRVLLNVYLPPRAGAGSVALPESFRAFAAAAAGRAPTVLVSLGNPYLLAAVPEVGSYLVAWGDREVSQRAAARAVVGAAPIGGRLPISSPPLHARGEGLQRAADPVMAARGALRGDALDEAGLLRHGPPPQTPPRDQGDPPPVAWEALSVSPMELADPTVVGMNPAGLQALDAYIEAAIADSVSPGVALAVGRGGSLVRLRGYGRLDWMDGSPPVTPSTIYDLASLTKVVGTTSAIMILADEGRLDLDAPVARYLPGWDRGDPRKSGVTVRDLLLHRGGLPPFRQYFLTHPDGVGVREAVYDLALQVAPRTEMIYSDIGFKTLAWVVEAVTGEPFGGFLEDRIWMPLGMSDTAFNPDPSVSPRVAPTEVTGNRGHVRGRVHDENDWVLGGVAGHAGLFSTAADLAVLMSALTRGGEVGPCGHLPGSGTPCARARGASVAVLPSASIPAFTRRSDASSSRALGWDTPSGRSSAGDYFSAASWGHTGFTGTSIWVDPELDLWVVLLTNRVNPTRENTRHIPFRRAVHDAVTAAVADRAVLPRVP
ncbi:glycoside hydrolase family 3 N-terminal domain-containing protein [soil metagenome]